MPRIDSKSYLLDWMQSVFLASIFIVASVVIFMAINLKTTNDPLFYFIWTFMVVMIAVFIAIFRWKEMTSKVFG